MIVKPTSNGGSVGDEGDIECSKVLARADARKHEQLRGFEGARTKDDLLSGGSTFEGAVMLELDCARAPFGSKNDPVSTGVGEHGKVRALARIFDEPDI
jgi:hypothetical protein